MRIRSRTEKYKKAAKDWRSGKPKTKKEKRLQTHENKQKRIKENKK